MTSPDPTSPEHEVTVTQDGPRWYLDCTCGHVRRYASKRAANEAGRTHLDKSAGVTP